MSEIEIPDHDHLVNGHCQFCALIDPELHSRRQCQCTLDELGQQIKCAWCRVKSFKALNARWSGDWFADDAPFSSDLTHATTERL